MDVKQFMKKNKYSFLLLLFLLTVVVAISASFTLSKYTRTVPVQELEIEVTDDPPVLYRGFITTDAQNLKISEFNGSTKIVMGSFNDYIGETGFDGDIEGNGLDFEDWKKRGQKYWVQQESAQTPEGTNLRGGIRLFFREENGEKVVYVLAKENYPVTFPRDSSYMFADLYGRNWTEVNPNIPLKTIDFQKINTSRVKNMQCMFWACSQLSALDLSPFNTKNVTDMFGMFGYNTNLSTLNLNFENFQTSNVTTMEKMFFHCENIKTVNLSRFDTSNVKTMANMFDFCSHLKTLDLSNFNTQNVTTMAEMFCDCHELETLEVSSFDTSNVTTMYRMFALCEKVKALDVSKFNTSKVTNNVTSAGGSRMFFGSYYLKGGAGTSYDGTPANPTEKDKTYARIDSGTNAPGYFTQK